MHAPAWYIYRPSHGIMLCNVYAQENFFIHVVSLHITIHIVMFGVHIMIV